MHNSFISFVILCILCFFNFIENMDWDFVYGMREVLSQAFLCKAMTCSCYVYFIYWSSIKITHKNSIICHLTYFLRLCPILIFIIKLIFINIWFAIKRLNIYILYARGLSKGHPECQVKWNVQMKRWHEMCPRLN